MTLQALIERYERQRAEGGAHRRVSPAWEDIYGAPGGPAFA